MYIKVKVNPGAREDKIKRVAEDGFEISVRAKPENNLANREVVRLLADNLKLPAGKIRLVTGHHNRSKIFDILQ